jgi:hypothetical protein
VKSSSQQQQQQQQQRNNNSSNNKSNSSGGSSKPNGGGGARVVDTARMLRLYERIRAACASRHIDTLSSLYRLVRPYVLIDPAQHSVKFDLFALDPAAVDKLERVLFANPAAAVSSSSTAAENSAAEQSLVSHSAPAHR